MKKASLILVVLVFSGAMFAQRGGNVSSTSALPGRSTIPSGTPIGGVNSVSPNGFSYSSICNQPGCGNAFFFYPIGSTANSISHPHNGHHNPNHPHHSSAYVIPYAYPVAVPMAVDPDEAVDPAAAEPDAPVAMPYEHRAPAVQPAPHVEETTDPQGKHVNLSPVSDEKIPVVIVFKDGHQQEISNGNYAIVGDLLYDLSGSVAHKIKLADLDLPQTVQLNEQRGVEFSVPASYKPQA